MKGNYLIKVKSVNIVEGDRTEREIITHADLSFTDDGYTFSYSEEKKSGDEETIITLSGKKITIIRHAEIETEMTVEEGKRHLSYHRLPFGEFSLDVVGTKVDSQVTDDGVKLNFSYLTYTEGETLGTAEFDMTLRRKGRISDKFLREE